MPRLLARYVMRQVALPTLLALFTITFVLLIGIIYDLMDLMLRPGVSMLQVLQVLVTTIPSFILFAAPMAALIGALIGVGRLTLDREVLAMRAAGVNILRIFAPMLLGALIFSGLIGWLNSTLIPRMMLYSMGRVVELQFQMMSGLEPGRFHDKLAGSGDADFILYFRERDEKTGQMRGVTIKMEEGIREEDQERFEQAQSRIDHARLSRALTRPGTKPVATPAPSPTPAPTPVAAAAATTATTASAGQSERTRGEKKADELYMRTRDSEITWIFAETGEIRADLRDSKGQRKAAEIILQLAHGSMHRLTPDPEARDYVAIPFDRMEKKLITSAVIKKANKTKTNAELKEEIRERRKGTGDERAALIERHAMALAFFVFTLLGIPLAIWIKPSGKSWGILLAIGLMLLYYVVMKMGLSGVEAGKPGGVLVAFMPNILFTVLGAGLWWHNLRS